MMYAIIEAGGRQWKVQPGTRFDINRLSSEVGAIHTVQRVLLAQDEAGLKIGRPYLPDAQVVCEVLAHRQGPKTIAYHYRRRENWRKTVGHRQPLTRLVVKDIILSVASAAQKREHAEGAAPRASSKPGATAGRPRTTERPAKTPTVQRAPKRVGVVRQLRTEISPGEISSSGDHVRE